MKVLHITPTFYPATYWGGPIYSLYGLCNSLAKKTHNIELNVLTTDSAGNKLYRRIDFKSNPVHYFGGYDVYFHRRLAFASVAPSIIKTIWQMIKITDIVHLTGIYSFTTFPTLLAIKTYRKPLVWSPRGSLQRWDNTTKPIIKIIWEKICNSIIDEDRTTMHVTSIQEANASKQRINASNVVIIPNGVSIPNLNIKKKQWVPNGIVRILFLGRIHPIKGFLQGFLP